MKSAAGWELYERMIARLIVEQSTTALSVTPNARIMGKISRRSRQIDVLINSRHNSEDSRRIIVDAKKRKRKIDVNDVEAFRGLMEDVGATHGYLVSPAGHTKAAEKRAQLAVSICIVPLDHLENFDPATWPKCGRSKCKHGRVFWDGYPAFTLRLHAVHKLDRPEPLQAEFVHYVGKCDRCGRFHVKCVTCGETLSVPEDEETDEGHQCRCRLPWFWLASIEEDADGCKSAELYAILGVDEVLTVDRRVC